MKNLFFALLILSGCSSSEKKSAFSNEAGTYIKNAVLNEAQVPLKIAFGSCAQPRQAQPLWEKIIEAKPDLYLALGDNTYTNSSDKNFLETAYQLQWQVPGWVQLLSSVPVLATWDDNDYGMNDGGKSFEQKQESRRVFLKYFDWLKPRMISEEGIYYSVTLGSGEQSVRLIFLDSRSFRDDLELNVNPKSPLEKYQSTTDAKKTILGPDQWKWLEEELQKPEPLKILVSSIQVIPTEQGFEKWNNFPTERSKLLRLFAKPSSKSVFILSGDRHFSEISEISWSSKKIVEFTGSAINRVSTIENEPNRFRQGKLFNKSNFGILEIDWSARTLGFRIQDLSGNVPLKNSYKF
jgi:alkaline phosphatase D